MRSNRTEQRGNQAVETELLRIPQEVLVFGGVWLYWIRLVLLTTLFQDETVCKLRQARDKMSSWHLRGST